MPIQCCNSYRITLFNFGAHKSNAAKSAFYHILYTIVKKKSLGNLKKGVFLQFFLFFVNHNAIIYVWRIYMEHAASNAKK